MQFKTFLIILAISSVIRYYALINSTIFEVFSNRVEISTPFNSWKRAIEGVHLKQHGISPYEGDTLHEPPLSLYFYEHLFHLDPQLLSLVFVLCDIGTALFLSWASKKYLQDVILKEGDQKNNYPPSVSKLLLKHQDQVQHVPYLVATVFLLNPYSLLTSAAKATVVFHNLVLSMLLCSAVYGQTILASVFLAIATYQGLYPVMLIVPIVLILIQAHHRNYKDSLVPTLFTVVNLFFLSLLCLLWMSHCLANYSWRFLETTYEAMVSVPDLTPNIGLFWYFFTEMFEHFRTFFLWTFQLNIFVYAVPLAIRLRREPLLLWWSLVALMAIFKPYPCVGDVGFYLSFLPTWQPQLGPMLRQHFLVGCVLSVCTVLAPLLWHLWIYVGSANANFYFALTLAFNTAQIFLVTDVLFAFIKREYYLQNGLKTDSNGKLVQLQLK